MSDSFVGNGIAGDLHGKDDDRLTSAVSQIWQDVGAAQKREKIKDWIRQQVFDGRVTDWLQYRELLQPYPKMHVPKEGMEAYEWYNGGDEDEEVRDENDVNTDEEEDEVLAEFEDRLDPPGEVLAEFEDRRDPPDDGEPPTEEDRRAIREALFAPSDEEQEKEGGRDHKGSAATVGVAELAPGQGIAEAIVPGGVALAVGPACHAEEDRRDEAAKNSLWCEDDARCLKASLAALAELRLKGGDKVMDQILTRRIQALRKKRADGSKPGALFLRKAAHARSEVMTEERRKVRERQHEIAMKKLEIKKAEVEVSRQRAEGGLTRNELKAKEMETKESKDVLKARQAHQQQRNQYLVLHLAAETKEDIDTYLASESNRKALLEQVKKAVLEQVRRLGKKRHATCPVFFTPKPDLLLNLDVSTVMKKKHKMPFMASESFRWHLYDGKALDQVTDPFPEVKLRKLLEKKLPGYFNILPFEHHVTSLIAHARGNLDAAFLEAVWRYGKMVGSANFPPVDALVNKINDQDVPIAPVAPLATASASSGAAASSSAASAGAPPPKGAPRKATASSTATKRPRRSGAGASSSAASAVASPPEGAPPMAKASSTASKRAGSSGLGGKKR